MFLRLLKRPISRYKSDIYDYRYDKDGELDLEIPRKNDHYRQDKSAGIEKHCIIEDMWTFLDGKFLVNFPKLI